MEIGRRCFLNHPHLLDVPPASSLSSLVLLTRPESRSLASHCATPVFCSFRPGRSLPAARPPACLSCPLLLCSLTPSWPWTEIRGWQGACCSEDLVMPVTLVDRAALRLLYPGPTGPRPQPCFLLLSWLVMATIRVSSAWLPPPSAWDGAG